MTQENRSLIDSQEVSQSWMLTIVFKKHTHLTNIEMMALHGLICGACDPLSETNSINWNKANNPDGTYDYDTVYVYGSSVEKLELLRKNLFDLKKSGCVPGEWSVGSGPYLGSPYACFAGISLDHVVSFAKKVCSIDLRALRGIRSSTHPSL